MKNTRFYLAALFTAFCLLCTPAITMAEEMQAQEVVAVNINSASAEELAENLIGVGGSRAELIVKFREENGPFTSVEQLLEVKGVGMATLEKNRERIQL